MADMDVEEGLERLAAVREKARVAREAIESFQGVVEEYIEVSGEAMTRFGYRSAGYMNFMQLARSGRDFRSSTMAKVLAYIEGQSAPSV